MCTEVLHAIHPFPLENIIHNRLTHSLAPTVLIYLLFRDQPESISSHNRYRYAIKTNVHHHDPSPFIGTLSLTWGPRQHMPDKSTHSMDGPRKYTISSKRSPLHVREHIHIAHTQTTHV